MHSMACNELVDPLGLYPFADMIVKKPPLKQGQGPLALVMAPTRELAQQIHVEADKFGRACGIKVAVVYGGAPKGPQIGELSRGKPALVVGTPGRINDLLSLNRPVVTNLDSCGEYSLAYRPLELCSLVAIPFRHCAHGIAFFKREAWAEMIV